MKKERQDRIIARGEVSGHSHIITGECTIERTKESKMGTASTRGL